MYSQVDINNKNICNTKGNYRWFLYSKLSLAIIERLNKFDEFE